MLWQVLVLFIELFIYMYNPFDFILDSERVKF